MKRLSQFIRHLYLTLFFITPLIFNFHNSELFELPKMYFVYLLSIIIISLHIINSILNQTRLITKNFLNLPLLLFLTSQVITSITSIDRHTSLFGYYSRINGGLLSIITFTLLFYSLTPYLTNKFKKNIIDISLISGLLVAIYGILQHFGIDQHLWVQDVQNRVFSTLGQPNWLAAYLCILIPLSLYRFFKAQTLKLSFIYYFQSLILFICLLFTKSRTGLIASLISLLVYSLIKFIFDLNRHSFIINLKFYLLPLTFFFVSLIIPNPFKDKIFFSNSLSAPTTQLTNILITPSEDIRKIVWRGSLNLWKKFPLFGTGVETFAYSYYWTRPIEHNLTSEWDFLYNKAHNEYLNYLATTGLIGFIPYLILITTILIQIIRSIFIKPNFDLYLAILASYLSILITNTTGFSVVITSLYFFLLPTLISPLKKPSSPKKTKSSLYLLIPFIITSLILVYFNLVSYLADIYYAKYQSADNQQNYSNAYKYLNFSLNLCSYEPNYLIGYGLAAAKMAVATKNDIYIKVAIQSADRAITISPANINFWRQRAQVYYYLSEFDSNYFITTIDSMVQAQKLAPTDPKNYYSLAQFLEAAELFDDAIFYYQQAIKLKPNYDHAYFALGKIFYHQKKYNLAQENLQQTINYSQPTNIEAQKILDDINQLQKH